MASKQETTQKAGQRLALVIAGVGIFWVLANVIGAQMGLTNRMRALFDLIALAGFAWAIFVAIGIWRQRQENKD